jgi:iron only hydrogenase large subunit-like protein
VLPWQNPYEVTTEDKLAAENPPPAQISLTDCLACSGCVTSAEAVLVSLQSHAEVLNALDSAPSLAPEWLVPGLTGSTTNDGRIFIASVSPQTRASIAATYRVSEREAGYMIEQLLSGPQGIRNGGNHSSRFTWIVDTNVAREVCLMLGAEEVIESSAMEAGLEDSVGGAANAKPKRPILTSSCPGWICYAEKTHPHILPHLSRLKSPQALLGTLLKTSLSSTLRIPPEKIWHVAVMPCFDKKLEASREELTDLYWNDKEQEGKRIRDVDCVITTKELVMLAGSRGIRFSDLPRTPLSPADRIVFPDTTLHKFLFPKSSPRNNSQGGTSGGYLHHILQTFLARHPGSSVRMERGRNADVAEFTVVRGNDVLLKTARYYGFRNIQNLVRKLKPPKKSRLPGGRLGGTSRKPGAAAAQATAAGSAPEHAYIEVMACPGGCTNGGGQIKLADALELKPENSPSTEAIPTGPSAQKQWLSQVDEAYFSSDSNRDEQEPPTLDPAPIQNLLTHWSTLTNIPIEKLVYTTYRKVESDVGKDRVGDTERVIELAGKIGGGW